MKSRHILVALLLALALTNASANQIRSGRFIIPPAPVLPEPERSSEMRACLEDLRARDAFAKIDQFRPLSDLPSWTRDAATSEVVFIYANVYQPDSFRFAVIRSVDGSVVIVRAGGLQDIYEVYEVKAAEPGATDNPGNAQ